MKKLSLLFISLFAASTLVSYSHPLTPQEALKRLESQNGNGMSRLPSKKLSLKYTLTDKTDLASIYVFGKEDSNGYVVMSADDAAYPVLGYSDEGVFNPDNIPPELKFWLEEYSRQIEYMRTKNYRANESSSTPFADLEPVTPLLKSKWNQGAPYNTYCYTIEANGTQTKSVTGCVATSMAQVMYYYKYPEIGHGSISYKHGDSGTYSMDFSAQSFDWNEMLPTYYPDSYTQLQGDAVAYLMKACGYSVKMDYSKGEAGANGAEIAGALINYFGYNTDIEVETRAFFTYDDWALMIYNNLKDVGPVVYNGSALDGGHSFVCDGYDGNGYFHFNWGWGGMSDGYYLLDALNPDEFGIGGAAGGYNLGQQVILNISPEKGLADVPHLMQFGNVTGKISDDTLALKLVDTDTPGLQYINPSPLKVTLGVKVVNNDDSSQPAQYFASEKKNLEASQGSYFNWEEYGTSIDLSKVDMTEADEYSFIIAVEINDGTTSQWTEAVAMPGKANYVTIVKEDGKYDVKNHETVDVKVTDFQIISSTVYLDKPVKFHAVFSNDGSQQLTRNYSAVFFNSEGEECYKMENYSVNVDAGATITDTWTSVNWYKEKGAEKITEATEFKVRLYDNWQGSYVEGIEEDVTVMPTNPEAKVESELKIVNAEKHGDVYEINGNELEVSLTIKVL